MRGVSSDTNCGLERGELLRTLLSPCLLSEEGVDRLNLRGLNGIKLYASGALSCAGGEGISLSMLSVSSDSWP